MPRPDPLDTSPKDHGSDRMDYIEIEAPPGIRPVGEWWDKIAARPCAHCRANIFARFLLGAGDADQMFSPHSWHITYAHDETCLIVRSITS